MLDNSLTRIGRDINRIADFKAVNRAALQTGASAGSDRSLTASRTLRRALLFAFISAVVSVKWMVAYLNRHGLEIFGYYRVVVALVVGVLLATHMI